MQNSKKITAITNKELVELKLAVQRKIGLLLGYRENLNGKTFYYVFPEHFKAFLAKNFELSKVLKILLEQGILEPNEKTGHLHTKIINGKEQSFYVLKQWPSGVVRKL